MKQYKVRLKGIESVRPRNLEPGDILARPVHSTDGKLILEANENLDDEAIQKLKSFDVRLVRVERPQERWFTGRKLDEFSDQYEILEKRIVEEEPDDREDVDSSEKTEVGVANSTVEELIRNITRVEAESGKKDIDVQTDKLESHLSELLPLLKKKRNLYKRTDENIDSPPVREKVKHALDGFKKSLGEEFLREDAPQNILEDTVEFVNEREETRNKVMETLETIPTKNLDIEPDSNVRSHHKEPNLRSIYQLMKDDDKAKQKTISWFDRIMERMNDHRRMNQDLIEKILNLIDDPKEMSDWIELLESDCTNSEEARDRFFSEDIDGDRAHLFETILSLNKKYRNLRKTIDRFFSSCSGLPSVQKAIDQKFIVSDSFETGVQRSNKDTSRSKEPAAPEAGTNDKTSDGADGLENQSRNVPEHHLQKHINENDFGTIDSEFLPGDSDDGSSREYSMNKLGQEDGDNLNQGNSQVNNDQNSILSLENLIETQNIPENVINTIQDLWIIPDEVEKRQKRVTNTIRKLILKMAMDEYVDVRQVKNLIETIEQFLDQGPKFTDLFLLPDNKNDFIIPHTYNSSLMFLHLSEEKTFHKQDKIHVIKSLLLKDIGLAYLPRTMIFPDDNLSPRARMEYSKHPLYSAHFAGNIKGYTDDDLDLIKEHHERCDGTGYPVGSTSDGQLELSSLIQLVTRYSGLCEGRTFRNPKKPDEVLEQLENHEDKYKSDLIDLLRSKVGYYPNGSAILLTNGQISVVKKQNSNHPRQPVVYCITDENQNKLEKPKLIDLVGESLEVESCLRM